MRCTTLALCLCAALVCGAVARPGSWGFGGDGHGDGGRRGDRLGRPGWGPGPDADAINVTIGIDRDAFLTGELNEDFCADVSKSGMAGGWSKLDTLDDINELELADEDIRNVTLAVMTRALPRRALRCRPENRTETIEGCSRVVEGTEYQLRLTVTCERRNRTNGSTVEVTGVVDALVAIPANDVPSINITGVELSIGGEWVNATELWQGADDRRPGGFPFPSQEGPKVDPMGPQDMSNGQPQDQPQGQAGSGDQAPEKPAGNGSQPEDGADGEPLL